MLPVGTPCTASQHRIHKEDLCHRSKQKRRIPPLRICSQRTNQIFRTHSKQMVSNKQCSLSEEKGPGNASEVPPFTSSPPLTVFSHPLPKVPPSVSCKLHLVGLSSTYELHRLFILVRESSVSSSVSLDRIVIFKSLYFDLVYYIEFFILNQQTQ